MTGNFSDQKMFKKENCIYFLNNKLIKIFLTCFPGNNIKLLLNLIFFLSLLNYVIVIWIRVRRVVGMAVIFRYIKKKHTLQFMHYVVK